MTPKEMMEKAKAIHTLNVASAQNVSASGDANATIQVMMYFPAWAIDQEYVAGHTVMWDGAPVVCVEGHSTALHPDWMPDTYAAGWRPWHATDPAYALPYLMLHSTYKYMAGEYCVWEDGQVYRCLVDNTVHSPGELPGSWEVWVAEPAESEPDGEEQPHIDDGPADWVPPTGAHDAYPIGAIVAHNGQIWRNTSAANVHAPGVWGWEVMANV